MGIKVKLGLVQRRVLGSALTIALLPLTYGALYVVSLPESASTTHDVLPTAASGQLVSDALLPIQEALGLDQRKVRLGQSLFLDPRLSANGEVSCSSCHDLHQGGEDGQRFSVGVTGRPTAVNTPTVLNAGLNFVQFWDGRAATLEDQVEGPITHPDEMGMTWAKVIPILSEQASYRDAFEVIYGTGITEGAIKDAIAEFERWLVTPNARFDLYLRGDETALDAQERRGYGYFVRYGCASCHQGRNIGGNLFQKLGVVRNYFTKQSGHRPADLGRFNQTGDAADRHVFKVPSLRNIALTAPYLHDGSIGTLKEVIVVMGFFQLGRRLSIDEVEDIEAFLITLTGELPEAIL